MKNEWNKSFPAPCHVSESHEENVMCIDILHPNILVSKTPAILRAVYLPFPLLPRTRVRKKCACNFIGKYLHHIVHTSENSHTRKKFISFIRRAFAAPCRFYVPSEKKFLSVHTRKGWNSVIQKLLYVSKCL